MKSEVGPGANLLRLQRRILYHMWRKKVNSGFACLVDGTGSRKSLAAPSATASKGKLKPPEEEYGEAVERPDADKRTCRLAPNGKRSNLTNAQYWLVRTKRFKDWFGDWGKVTIAKAILDEDEIVSQVKLLGMKPKEQRARARKHLL